jgi:hypothetical protein
VSQIPEAEMGGGTLARGLVYVRPHKDGIEALCDCGTVTVLVIDPDEAATVTETREVPWTCGGCNSVHWLTLVPTGEGS